MDDYFSGLQRCALDSETVAARVERDGTELATRIIRFRRLTVEPSTHAAPAERATGLVEPATPGRSVSGGVLAGPARRRDSRGVRPASPRPRDTTDRWQRFTIGGGRR